MLRCIVLVLLSIGWCRGAEPKPILVVLEQDPWRSVVGSDSPTFALYADGTMLYLGVIPNKEEPFQTRTVTDANAKADDLLGYVPGLMKDRYVLSAASDQITTVIWTPSKRIEIYGGWRRPRDPDPDPLMKETIVKERGMWESLPPQIRAALSRIDDERARLGERWLPAKVEVMFWPYEYAPDESIIWPKDWPGLAAADSRKRGDLFSVFLPSGQRSELWRFLETRKKKGAVLIDGKKMTAATRFPFPGEEAWMR